MSSRAVMIVAGIMVCLLASTLLMAVPYMGLVAISLVVGGFVYLGTLMLKDSGQKRYQDPYDLDLLREVHEKKLFEKVDETPVPDEADVMCPHCGHVYGHKFKACPMCKRVP